MLDRAARVGLVAHGAIYLAFALVAVLVAAGEQRDEQGALAVLAESPGGAVLLWGLAVGLATYGVWRASLAARDIPEPGRSPSVAQRLANAGRAVVAACLAVTCAGAMVGEPGRGEDKAAGTVLNWPGGPVLVAAAGVAVAAVSVGLAVQAVRGGSRRRVGGGGAERWLVRVAVVGDVARAAVFTLVGWFLVNAAIQHDPSEARSLDASLLELADARYGSWLLVAAAAGLACFAAAQLAEARYRPAART